MELPTREEEVLMDTSANHRLCSLAAQPKLVASPALPLRGIKDEMELDGFREATLQDGVAL